MNRGWMMERMTVASAQRIVLYCAPALTKVFAPFAQYPFHDAPAFSTQTLVFLASSEKSFACEDALSILAHSVLELKADRHGRRIRRIGKLFHVNRIDAR
jgi:hypothetical protein